YVLGTAVGLVQSSGLLKNSRFREHLLFFTELQNAITHLQRRSMREEWPAVYSAISEEISDKAISELIVKMNRERLKKKFKAWEEEEMLMEEVKEFNFTTNAHYINVPKASGKIWILVVVLI